jgi:dihydrofolate reductase
MPILSCFNFISLNGFYKGLREDISWHRHGEEESQFSAENAQKESILLFGRVTYEMMYSFWATEQAMAMAPQVAEGVNRAEKIVFSRTMEKAQWNNSRVVQHEIYNEVRKLKETGTKDMTILGSGSIVSQLSDHGLIDLYSIMLDPVAIPYGTSIFHGISKKLDLELISTRTFKSGVVLLNYRPIT